MNLTHNALTANAITLAEADELETFFDTDDWSDENDMPPNIRRVYEIALMHY